MTRVAETGVNTKDPTAGCLPPGMPRMMSAVYPMEILMTPGLFISYRPRDAFAVALRRFAVLRHRTRQRRLVSADDKLEGSTMAMTRARMLIVRDMG